MVGFRNTREKIESLYNKLKPKTQNLIAIIQIMNNFSPKIMTRLANDFVYNWSDDECKLLIKKLIFPSLQRKFENLFFLRFMINLTSKKEDKIKECERLKTILTEIKIINYVAKA